MEKKYYFVAGDVITIPEACQVVFYSLEGETIYPEFRAVMVLPKELREEE